jgi:hypothetical protein
VYLTECDLETSKVRKHRPELGSSPTGGYGLQIEARYF